MSRLEKYREIRITRKRYLLSVIIFLMLIIPGLCIVDYSVNSIMKGENRIDVLAIKNIKSQYIEITLMNRKHYINTVYLRRDYERFKKIILKTER